MDPTHVYAFGYVFGVLLVLLVLVALWLFVAYVLSRIGRKFGVGAFWQYCIPVYNAVLACRWIGLPGLAALWFFLPALMRLGFSAFQRPVPELADALFIVALLYVPFVVYFCGTVARRLGKNFWLYGTTTGLFAGLSILFDALSILFPYGNSFRLYSISSSFVASLPILFLAFDESRPQTSNETRGRVVGATSHLALYCVSGELAHTRLEVPSDGLYIGRNPAKANLVLNSDQVSNIHARVWPNPSGSGLWLQDWNSLNGTYYCRSVNGERDGRSKWKVLHGQVLLSSGAHFRLGDKVVEFEVRGA